MPSWYHRYVIVSEYRKRDCAERQAAMSWLQRQMAWEQVLGRLRRQAGVDAEHVAEVPAAA